MIVREVEGGLLPLKGGETRPTLTLLGGGGSPAPIWPPLTPLGEGFIITEKG